MTRTEATQELIDLFMWGEKYLGVDITYILDGEVIDELLLLTVQRKHDEAIDWLSSIVKRFMETETGQKLVDSFLADRRESEKLSVLEDRAELLYQEA